MMNTSSRLRSLPWFVASSCVVVLAGLTIVPQAAIAELRYSTSYRENPVRGSTPGQLWRSMGSHPIFDEDGPALANITHEHELDVTTEKASGVCRVGDLDFTWRFVITLPRAVDEAAMSRQTRAMWREFVAFLKRHEEQHRTIFIGCGQSFVAEAAKLTAHGSCLGLKRKVARYIDDRYDVCMTEQRAFDRRQQPSLAKLALRRAQKE